MCGFAALLTMREEGRHPEERALARVSKDVWRTRSCSTRALFRAADLAAQCLQLLACRAGRVAFDLAVTFDQRETERGQRCAAAILAAGLPLDGGLAADAVDLVDQVPRPLVGHVHRTARGRDRTAFIDVLQQRDFSRPDPALRIEIDTDAEGGKRF